MNFSQQQWARPENLAGLLITISFHAACAALLQATWPPSFGHATRPSPARYVYWKEPHAGPGPDTWDSDPRALGSPILFALPTEVGFSPPPRRRLETIPSFQLVGSKTLLLDRLQPDAAAPSFAARNAADVRFTLDHRWSGLTVEADPFEATVGTGAVLHVEWPDGAPEWVSGLPIVISALSTPGERAWEASAWVHVSEAGDVAGVFLIQPTADRERNEAIVRALRALRATHGREGRYRVNLYALPRFERPAGGMP